MRELGARQRKCDRGKGGIPVAAPVAIPVKLRFLVRVQITSDRMPRSYLKRTTEPPHETNKSGGGR